MRLNMLAKDPGSDIGGCPAVYDLVDAPADVSKLYDMHYDTDGTWLGIEPVTDPAMIVQACAWRDAALHLGVPWQTYVRVRPQLMEHLSLVPVS